MKTRTHSRGFLIVVLILSTASFVFLYHYHKEKYTGNTRIEKEALRTQR